VLLLHQARAPGKRLTLKCPHHLAWLPALREAIPEALIVQTHRDPVEAVPSECKLILSLHGLSTHEIDWRETVEHNHLKISTFARRSLAYADSADGASVAHVDYRRLVSEPVAVAREIHQRFGLEFDDAEQAALDRFFANNRQHKHGKNSYQLAQFGLDAEQINAGFADYRARFLSK
ncbi:MAG TPA: sulfotransferase, partial [Enhygromyxa sp.]|nr:sulfotransferase [Enhygromyxa sp.]